jgi:hypothetical protein
VQQLSCSKCSQESSGMASMLTVYILIHHPAYKIITMVRFSQSYCHMNHMSIWDEGFPTAFEVARRSFRSASAGAVERCAKSRSGVRFPVRSISYAIEWATLCGGVGFIGGTGFFLRYIDLSTLSVRSFCS